MKATKRILIFIAVANICSAQKVYESNLEMPCFSEERVFEVGEKLTYKMYYNWGLLWVSAGEVIFEVAEKGDDLHLKATGYTYNKYDKFFKVRDYYESIIDKETLLPKEFKRNVQEGKYIRFDSISFDQANHTVKEYFGTTKAKAKETTYELNHCVHDMMSIVYSLRNLDITILDDGDRLPMDIFFDKELFNLSMLYESAQTKRIKGLGKCSVRKFSPTLITGNVFTEEAKMNIYVSDDRNKIPLLIESPVSVGSVKAILSSYEGVAYPMESIK